MARHAAVDMRNGLSPRKDGFELGPTQPQFCDMFSLASAKNKDFPQLALNLIQCPFREMPQEKTPGRSLLEIPRPHLPLQ